MREFFELVNEYPWTTFFLIVGLCGIIEETGEALSEIIHGPSHKVIIKTDDKKENE